MSKLNKNIDHGVYMSARHVSPDLDLTFSIDC